MFGLSENPRLSGRICPVWVPATYDRLAESQPESPVRGVAS
jgi:hypothetical protein